MPCEYVTPAGECGEDGTQVTIAGVQVTLCEDHLPTVVSLNDGRMPA